jgi:two-component system, cell cycle sensor histidine kinase and response regulator CckA
MPPGPPKSKRMPAVLVVDDDPQILDVLAELLQVAGYEVETAADCRAAHAVVERRGETLDLLLTDVLLPVTNGKILADQLTARCPTLRVLYMSGYADHELAALGVQPNPATFLRKPFTYAELCDRLNTLLEAGVRPT